jgi:transcriptional regulator with XRE-family HTH domain
MAQRDLAAASGVGAATIARLERGQQLARPSTVRRLVKALDIRPDDLMAELSPETSGKEGE